MNINLSRAAAKQKGRKNPLDNSTVSFGLNRRGGGVSSVLDDGDDSDSSENEEGKNSGVRDEVNRNLAAEQAALRKRAEAAMIQSTKDGQTDLYDYDGAYDSIQSKREAEKQHHEASKKSNRGSRYVSDLLNAAKNRERERDVIYERKLAKEQEAEERDNEEFKGKEKFVTGAYKRKLAERQLWDQQEKEKRLKEEQDDVSKKISGDAIASFYGNLNRNVAMGGRESNKEAEMKQPVSSDNDANVQWTTQRKDNQGSEMSFLEGFERAEEPVQNNNAGQQSTMEKEEVPEQEDAESRRTSARKAREEKVAQARIRYFQRHGLSNEATNDTRQQ